MLKRRKECVCGKNNLGIGVDDVRKWYRIPGAALALAGPLLLPFVRNEVSQAVLFAATLGCIGAYGYFLYFVIRRFTEEHKLYCALRYAFLKLL